jgi:hypothetical protein
MAAGAFTLYSNAVLSITMGAMNLSSDSFVMTLVGNSYTPAPNTDALWSAVSANELTTAGGYTAGGVLLASEMDTLIAGTVTFKATSPSWATFSAGPFRYAVISRRAGGSLIAGDLLLCYSDLTGGGTITGSGGTYTVSIGSSGIFQATHSP